VSVLTDSAALDSRRAAAAGPLRALADSLAIDLQPVLARDLFIPAEKARLTRRGGRCESDGTLLEFDPFAPRDHRCPKCGVVFTDESHYRWWIMGYHLWLAERAVHAAALYALRGDDRHRDFARAVLDAYSERYLTYPNKDNVLGPTRLFFSTYLESIWLLQLIVALDLLESAAPSAPREALGARVRERIVEPSAVLIASYDEGLSNRQVWNNAALLASSRLLHGRADESPLVGPSGLIAHLTSGLLGDGTWYEGENYHLFAHRGLWYGVTIAAASGVALDSALLARFDEAFATPFVTALPDFTFPSRRDSQYRVSLRQWRFAELAELGVVRQPGDARLTGALATLYDGTVPRGDTGRARSTAEAERNSPATGLDRADLGWRSLLFASPSLPPLAPWRPKSALLSEQGLAILRRDGGSLYAALDYGHSGAGHGHPDRLNMILVHRDNRWLDDVGTGSYVDPSLHWYRSTLAHNAPLVNGRSQERVHGTLIAYEDRGGAGWVRAFADGVAPGVRLERTIVAMPTYIVDELTWRAEDDVDVDVPFHADGELGGVGPWTPTRPAGGTDAEDGFRYLVGPETASSDADVRLRARLGDASADAYIFVDVPHAWWRATALGAPGAGPARFHFVRARARRGSVLAVWDVLGAVQTARATDGGVVVELRDGTRHEHRSDASTWHIGLAAGVSTSSIDLSGATRALPRVASQRQTPLRPIVLARGDRTTVGGPAMFELGEAQYRRAESSWLEAGKPTATVSIATNGPDLVVTVDVRKQPVYFAPAASTNALDNEHPDTNSDGVQLHVVAPASTPAHRGRRELNWLLVPELDSDRVRVTARASAGDAPPLGTSWARTAGGYCVRIAVPIDTIGVEAGSPFKLGVVVNDMTADRERRRGQLVLGGAPGQFVYLRGDRLPAEDQLDFVIADG
jgi:heparinase II/III-like protein